MHRLLTLIIFSITLLAGSAFAYSDVDGNVSEGQAAAIEALSEKGFMQGYTDGTFRPTQSVNRAEFLKVLVAASGTPLPDIADTTCFKDFQGTAQWYWIPACAAKRSGIIDGYPDSTFRGEKFINVAEGMKIAVNAFNIPLPMYIRAPDNWYDPYIDAVSGRGVFGGAERDPAHLLTRAEMAFLVRALSTDLSQCEGHVLGETYKSSDGCNTCTCTEHGGACTKMACPIPEKLCTSTSDCAPGLTCSTERGDCRSLCAEGQMCPSVCAGVCE